MLQSPTHTSFERVLNALNPSQRQAVDTLEGVVMVVAGPGTGKTQVLGARVAKLLSATDTQAHNILCLTFTEAATVALRNRLIDFIGTDAQRVNIYTYHAFCNQVIQDNKHLFGYSEMDAASDLDLLAVIKELIDELPNDHLLKRFKGDAYFDSSSLKKLFGLMKKDRMTAEDVSALVHEKIAEAENDESYRYKRDGKYGKKGELNTQFTTLKNQLLKLEAAAGLLPVFNGKLLQRRRYDYNDMIHWVIDEFNSNKDLLLNYQEQFQYILVDEYQDTNGAQNELLYQLIDYWDNPNVFVVGDDDQSIYKFQGANVENIYQFYSHYQNYAKLIVLEENYRSVPSVLEVSNSLIANNKERLVGRVPGLSKQISAAHQDLKNEATPVLLNVYPTIYQEIVGIGQEIKALHAQQVAWNEMAIIYRNHDQSEDLMRYLQAEGIPYQVTVAVNVLDQPIVQHLIQLLDYLQREDEQLDKGQGALFEIFHSSNFRFLSPFEIAQLSRALNGNYKLGWRTQLLALKQEDAPYLSQESYNELKRFMADLEYWLKEMHNVSLQNLIEQVLAKGGFISRALAGSESIFEIQCLKTVFDLVKDESSKQPRLGLKDFLNTLELMDQNNLKLGLNKIVHGAHGIQLMTAHSSKGLEFGHVFIMGCTANKWEKNGNRLPFNLNKIIEGEPLLALEEEGRRLFYVALTRAKQSVHISYAQTDIANKPLNRSIYVAEIENEPYVNRQEVAPDEERVAKFFGETLDVSKVKFQKLTQLDFVDRELERFRLNATNLNAYLRCPVAFFYQHIVHVPAAKNEHMSFGTAMHAAMEYYFKAMLAHPDRAFPPASQLQQRFVATIMQHQESFTPESLKRFTDHGRITLQKQYAAHIEKWNSNRSVVLEADIKHVEVNGVPIRGKIDKILQSKNDLTVVDYKTGKHSKSKNKMNPPVDASRLKPGETDRQKILGGDYWRQIVFYRILIEADPRYTLPVSAGILDFLEAENDTFFQPKIVINDSDRDIVVTQIEETYKAIMNKEFDDGCGEDTCVWCNFNTYYLNKRQSRQVELLNSGQEEIDER